MAATKHKTAKEIARTRALAADRQRNKRARDAGMVRSVAAGAASPRATRKPTTADENRVASRTKRDRFVSRAWGGHLSNNDPTLLKFSSADGIGLYTRILHQFANVMGYCQAWVDHVLVQDRVFKPAKAIDPAQQDIADAAAARAQRAWLRVKNRTIVMQKLLMGRFYGFYRAEKVARFDEIMGEWIPDLYDVPPESWRFDDDGSEWLIKAGSLAGVQVDPKKFMHFQWGSADSKYGKGDLSYVYLSLWKIQKLETMALQRIEDNESVALVHVPRSMGKEKADIEATFAEEFRKVIGVPTDETKVSLDMPTINVTANGMAGHPEYEGIRFHERWVQTMILGAPQTGDRSLGTGKLEETRSAIWDDKTPIGSSALDQCITDDWLATYCDWNMADLPLELRPKCESDSADIAEGLTGIQAQEARNIALDLSAQRITATIAIELWGALGISRTRAQVMADSILKERDSLVSSEPTSTLPPNAAKSEVPTPDPSGEESQEAA